MAATLSGKLKIKQGQTLLVLNEPNLFLKTVDLPPGVQVNGAASYNQVHWYVRDKKQLETQWPGVLPYLGTEVITWIYFPKSTSGIQTDLTRDSGWEVVRQALQPVTLISFDPTWSAFAFRLKKAGKEKERKPAGVRPIFNYIDPVAKKVVLPDDFSASLMGYEKAAAFFETLSFTNRKEYVEWIVSAKKEATRALRVQESVKRLEKGWKNPANR